MKVLGFIVILLIGYLSVSVAQDCSNRLCPILQDQDIIDAAADLEAYDPTGPLLADVAGDLNRATCPLFPRSLRSKAFVSVHCAQPSDLRVFATLGDSISTGTGAGCDSETIDCVLDEFRGPAFSSGVVDSTNGYRERTLTLPNLFRQFSGFVLGGGRGVNGLRECEFDPTVCNKGFNYAVSGAIMSEVPEHARRLVAGLGDLRTARVPKVITIFMGGNDVCCQCSAIIDVVGNNLCSREGATAQSWAVSMRETLQILKDNLENTIVNLIGMFDVTGFQEVSGFFCNQTLPFFCPCAFLPEISQAFGVPLPPGITREFINTNLVVPLIDAYNQESQSIADELSGPMFEVIYHPLGRDFTIPKNPDGTFNRNSLSIDCFHFSHSTHASLATTLWNSMMRVDKPTDLENEIQCPSTRYIPTRLNENGTKCPFTRKPHQ